jgi:hypothetical protein
VLQDDGVPGVLALKLEHSGLPGGHHPENQGLLAGFQGVERATEEVHEVADSVGALGPRTAVAVADAGSVSAAVPLLGRSKVVQDGWRRPPVELCPHLHGLGPGFRIIQIGEGFLPGPGVVPCSLQGGACLAPIQQLERGELPEAVLLAEPVASENPGQVEVPVAEGEFLHELPEPVFDCGHHTLREPVRLRVVA